jgi:hypothetical protein
MLTIIRDDPPDTMTITLDPPVAYKGGEIAELVLKEPTARQVRDAEREYNQDAPWAGAVSYEMKLIGLVAGLTPVALEKLPVGVCNYAATFLQEFVEAGATDPEDADEDRPPPEAGSLPIEPPIKFAGVTYSDLDLREPLASEIRNARQLMRSSGSLFESRRAQMQLVTAVSGLPAPVVDALPIRQLNQAARILGRFSIAGRPTGKR